MTNKVTLCAALGVSDRTLSSKIALGFCIENNELGGIDIEKTTRAYIKFISEQLRKANASSARKTTRSSRSSEAPELSDIKPSVDWEEEKEKQAALKLKIANMKALGALVPSGVILDIITPPMNQTHKSLRMVPQTIKQRGIDIPPDDLEQISQIIDEAIRAIDTEERREHFTQFIHDVISQHTDVYRAAEEGPDIELVEGEPKR